MTKESGCNACIWGHGLIEVWPLGYSGLLVLVLMAILSGNSAGEEWVSIGACLILLTFHLVGVPVYSGFIDGKLHRHLREESVVRDDEGKKVLQFDQPVILKYISGIFRQDHVIGDFTAMCWEVVRTGIGPDSFVLREVRGDKRSIRAPLTEYLKFWLKQPSVSSVVEKLQQLRRENAELGQNADQLVSARNELSGALAKALACIEYMLAGMQVLRERIKESGKVKPRHQCAIATPIKDVLVRIAGSVTGDTRRALNMSEAAVASRTTSWRDNMPPLVEPKAPTSKAPGNTLEQT